MTATTQAVNVGDLSQTEIRFVQEVTWGVDIGASATYQIIPFNSETLHAEQPSIVSDIVDASRRIKDVIFTDLNALGDITSDLQLEAFDPWFEAVAMGDYVAQASISASQSTTVANSGGKVTFTRVSGSFITDGWAVGDWGMPVAIASSATNKQPRKVSAVTALVLTMEGPPGVAEAVATPMTRLKTVTDANVFRSYSITKDWTQYTDRFMQYLGMTLNAMSMQLAAKGKVTVTFSFIGKSEDALGTEPGDGSPTAAPTNRIVSVSNGVPLMMEGGTGTARLVQMSLNYANGLYAVPQAGTFGPIAVGQGTKSANGSYETYVTDTDGFELMDKWHDQTESAVAYVLKDPNGNFLVLDHPTILYTNMSAPLLGKDQPSVVRAEWTAKPSTENSVEFLWRTAIYTNPL